MNLRDFYNDVGGNYDTVILRLLNDTLILKFVKKFLNDPSYNNLNAALVDGDIENAFLAAHTLKGTAANLGFDALADAASKLTEELRGASKIPNGQYFTAVDKAYKFAVEKIAQLD